MLRFVKPILIAFLFASSCAPVRAQSGNATSLQSALTATVVTVKAVAGQLAWVNCHNPNASVAYMQAFNVAGVVTLGVTEPKLSIPIASASVTSLFLDATFLTAIKVAATTTATGSSAPAVNLVCNIGFK